MHFHTGFFKLGFSHGESVVILIFPACKVKNVFIVLMLGTILEVFSGQDGVVRTARVKQGDGLVKVHSLKN